MYKSILAALIAQNYDNGADVTDETLTKWVEYSKTFESRLEKINEAIKLADKENELAICAWLYSVYREGDPTELTVEPTLGKALRHIEIETGVKLDRSLVNYNITREDYKAPLHDKETGEKVPYYVTCRPGTKKRRNEIRAARLAEKAAADLAKAQAAADHAEKMVAEAEALPEGPDRSASKLDAALDPKVAEEIGVAHLLHDDPRPDTPTEKAAEEQLIAEQAANADARLDPPEDDLTELNQYFAPEQDDVKAIRDHQVTVSEIKPAKPKSRKARVVEEIKAKGKSSSRALPSERKPRARKTAAVK
jgi:hypothetical protein